MPEHLLDLDPPALSARLAAWGEPAYRAKQIARWALRRGVTDFEAMSDLPAALRTRLATELTIDPPPVIAQRTH